MKNKFKLLPITAQYTFCIVLAILLTGCDKQHAKKLAGSYDCTVKYDYWDEMPTVIDTSYQETIVVTSSKEYINVLDREIHIDSLWEGQEYTDADWSSGYGKYLTIRFENETLYAKVSASRLPFEYTYIYEGSKN
jgi:hypothetical protein